MSKATMPKACCSYCGGQFGFPLIKWGPVAKCPYCGNRVVLEHVVQTSKSAPLLVRPKIPISKALVVLGTVSAMIIVVWLIFSQFSPGQNPNLKAANGAFGWTLGAVLPDNYEVKTNDADGYGITYDFDPQDEMTNLDILMAHLVLTEDRRIAEIYIYGVANDDSDIKQLIQTLSEKYGLQGTEDLGTATWYSFGKYPRGVRLSVEGPSGLAFDLTYDDYDLGFLAATEMEKRKAATSELRITQMKDHF